MNAKTLCCIFNGISPNEVSKIATCVYTKKAWDILVVTDEDTSNVQLSKLQMLTIKFENIMMKDNETFFEFYIELSDININSCFNLEERIFDFKVVKKKNLRSLLEKSRPKAIAIEISKNVTFIRVNERENYVLRVDGPLN